MTERRSLVLLLNFNLKMAVTDIPDVFISDVE